jgi:hypothetical protein
LKEETEGVTGRDRRSHWLGETEGATKKRQRESQHTEEAK